MGFITQLGELSVRDLQAMAKGCMHSTVNDIDFLETLAAKRCIVVPPWIVRVQPTGGLARVARLVYDTDGNIDKVRVLLAMAKEFRRAEKRGIGFGGRFSL
jgi:hypothetical protein